MDLDRINELAEALDIIEAQRFMESLKAARSPHMKDRDFEELHKYVHKRAYPAAYEEQRRQRVEALKSNA